MSSRRFSRSPEGKSCSVHFNSWKELSRDIDTLAAHPELKRYREKIAKDCEDRDNGIVDGVYGAKDLPDLLGLPTDFPKTFERNFAPELFPRQIAINGKAFWLEFISAGFSFFPVVRISTPVAPRTILAEISLVQHVPNVYRRHDGTDFSMKQLQAWGALKCAELSEILNRLSR